MNEEKARQSAWQNPSGTPESVRKYFGAPQSQERPQTSHREFEADEEETQDGSGEETLDGYEDETQDGYEEADTEACEDEHQEGAQVQQETSNEFKALEEKIDLFRATIDGLRLQELVAQEQTQKKPGTPTFDNNLVSLSAARPRRARKTSAEVMLKTTFDLNPVPPPATLDESPPKKQGYSISTWLTFVLVVIVLVLAAAVVIPLSQQ